MKYADIRDIIKGTIIGVCFHPRAVWHCCTESLSFTAYDDVPSSASLRTLFVTTYLTGMLLLGCYSAGFITNLTLRDPTLPFTDFEGLLKDGTYRLGMALVNEQLDYFRVSILWDSQNIRMSAHWWLLWEMWLWRIRCIYLHGNFLQHHQFNIPHGSFKLSS